MRTVLIGIHFVAVVLAGMIAGLVADSGAIGVGVGVGLGFGIVATLLLQLLLAKERRQAESALEAATAENPVPGSVYSSRVMGGDPDRPKTPADRMGHTVASLAMRKGSAVSDARRQSWLGPMASARSEAMFDAIETFASPLERAVTVLSDALRKDTSLSREARQAMMSAVGFLQSGNSTLLSPNINELASQSDLDAESRGFLLAMLAQDPNAPAEINLPRPVDDDESDAGQAVVMGEVAPEPAPLPGVPALVDDVRIDPAVFDSYEFDVFRCAKASANNPLLVVAMYSLNRLGVMPALGIDPEKVRTFVTRIEAGYRAKNPYHNNIHAADVVHGIHCIMMRGLAKHLSDLEVFAAVVAAIVHDVEHPGNSNTFEVNTSSRLALLYNDQAVLENHHLATAFAIMHENDENSMIQPIKAEPDRYKSFRNLIVQMVLATDLARHFDIVNKFKLQWAKVINKRGKSARRRSRSRGKDVPTPGPRAASVSPTSDQSKPEEAPVVEDLESRPFPPGSEEKQKERLRTAVKDSELKLLVLQMALKVSDLGHPAQAFDFHYDWSGRMQEESFLQGDRERELRLPVSAFADRHKSSSFSQSQIGFIDFIVLPLYESFIKAMPTLADRLATVKDNKAKWPEPVANQIKAVKRRKELRATQEADGLPHIAE